MGYIKDRLEIEKDIYKTSKIAYIVNRLSIIIWTISVIFSVPEFVGVIGFVGYLITLAIMTNNSFKEFKHNNEGDL